MEAVILKDLAAVLNIHDELMSSTSVKSLFLMDVLKEILLSTDINPNFYLVILT
jgi:hypothetical protein